VPPWLAPQVLLAYFSFKFHLTRKGLILADAMSGGGHHHHYGGGGGGGDFVATADVSYNN
jgi:hypothetical protein